MSVYGIEDDSDEMCLMFRQRPIQAELFHCQEEFQPKRRAHTQPKTDYFGFMIRTDGQGSILLMTHDRRVRFSLHFLSYSPALGAVFF